MYKVVSITPDTVTVWDGKSYVLPGHQNYKATMTFSVGFGHDFKVDDEVVISIRKAENN